MDDRAGANHRDRARDYRVDARYPRPGRYQVVRRLDFPEDRVVRP